MPVPGRIEATYLFSRACPSHQEGLDLLVRAAGEAGVELELEVVEVTSDAQAEELRFPGSPTYLAEGRDLFDPAEPVGYHRQDACRPYHRSEGRIGPLPRREDLVRALRAAAGR